MSFDQLLTQDTSHHARIAVVNAHNEATIRVVIRVLETTSATFTFYNHQDVSELIRSFDLAPQLLTRITMHTYETEEATLEQCLNDLNNHQADILMKGHISTAKILSAVLRHHSAQGQHFLNHVAVCDIPAYHKPLFISDVALNIQPTKADMTSMIGNITTFAAELGYAQLKVALLSSTETPNPKLASSVQAAELKEDFKAHSHKVNVKVDGPLALDNIIDKKSAIQKGIQSEVAGDADVIIVPHLDVGNALYKSLTYFGRARVASVVLGANFPIVLTSRADAMSNKINSVLLAMKILVN
ncbi:phosphate butyryltransferase [Staphylococcus microti]|uniref:Phosphate butyryltransferase n=1 Tax=Staphylococcus microti TaxID=569857 RepID=A0A0D6XRX0_9STAP|nr:phosphate acyltransferase [Staphylococcus microti]KIX91554.1 phosphate butyryltransferase [Staphylococcus microti]PNZ81012.1 phosphate butyryltransferase [Staphylococcus microti]SUM57569.1 phosphate butyryltransferase [Staphylococcus microti]